MAFLSAISTDLAARARTRVFRLLAVLAAGWLWTAPPAPAAEPSAEYQVKAVFLFNFALFVEWPATTFADDRAPLVIGVLGDDPFGPYLDELVRSEQVGGRPLQVRRLHKTEEIAGCHILFVSHGVANFDRIAADLRGHNVLTVGDTDNFNRLGGMVRFAMENGKIRLRINAAAAQDTGLTISSKLLRWATIVTPEKG